MKNKFLKYLYSLYKDIFFRFFIDDMIGIIPESVTEPSNEFFRRADRAFEQFLLYQSYELQKRMLDEPKRGQLYEGMLLNIRLYQKLLLNARQIKKVVMSDPDNKKKDPLIGVQEFLQRSKAK
jgi:hypothetical protein